MERSDALFITLVGEPLILCNYQKLKLKIGIIIKTPLISLIKRYQQLDEITLPLNLKEFYSICIRNAQYTCQVRIR